MSVDAAAFADAISRHPSLNVSRETIERLCLYGELLTKWQRAYNLVASATLEDSLDRHFVDSLQILPHISPHASLLDLGSGGGFPGLVLAIARPGQGETWLLEANQKKCQFLREVIRQTGANARVLEQRIELGPSLAADFITARALAPLEKLLEYHDFHGHEHTIGCFLKGRGVHEELTQARRSWTFDSECIPSLTDPDAALVRVTGVQQAVASGL